MRSKRRQALAAYLFIAPALILFVIFVLVPVVSVVFLSFTKYKIITPAQWIGMQNWTRVFSDVRLAKVSGNTALFALLLAPMHMVVGMLMAVLAYGVKSKGRTVFYRTILYFPTLVATSAVAIAWTFIFNKDMGMLNYYLGKLGIAAIPWLSSSFWAYPATMIFSLWKNVGIYFLYFLVGLQSMDNSLLEAADIDGASRWVRFKSVMFPMISPTVFFVLTTMLIGVVQIFDEPYLLTQGGPGDSTRSISQYIFETAYRSQAYGYASAIALVLLAVVLVITLIQFQLQNRWVNYDRE